MAKEAMLVIIVLSVGGILIIALLNRSKQHWSWFAEPFGGEWRSVGHNLAEVCGARQSVVSHHFVEPPVGSERSKFGKSHDHICFLLCSFRHNLAQYNDDEICLLSVTTLSLWRKLFFRHHMNQQINNIYVACFGRKPSARRWPILLGLLEQELSKIVATIV